mgnify:CR=1 FL=1
MLFRSYGQAMSGNQDLYLLRKPETKPNATTDANPVIDSNSVFPSRACETREIDSRDQLMLKMMEIQLEMARQLTQKSDTPTVEDVKSITASFPKLEAPNEESAIKCGDFLVRIKTIIGGLTKNSYTCWDVVMHDVTTSYNKYLLASPIERLTIWPDLTEDDKFDQLQKKVAHMLLESLDEHVLTEIMASRKIDPRSIIFKLMTIYQPGGTTEKTQLLETLTKVKTEVTVTDTIKTLRDWIENDPEQKNLVLHYQIRRCKSRPLTR